MGFGKQVLKRTAHLETNKNNEEETHIGMQPREKETNI